MFCQHSAVTNGLSSFFGFFFPQNLMDTAWQLSFGVCNRAWQITMCAALVQTPASC